MTPSPSTRTALAVLTMLTTVGCGGTETVAHAPAASLASTASSALKGGNSSAGSIASLTLSSPAVTAGNGVLARVTLTGPAQSPSGGVVVYVDFRSMTLAGPRFIRIPNGQSSGIFMLYSNPFLSLSTTATISASTSTPQPASLLTQTLSITSSPTPPTTLAPQVSSLTLSASMVTSGSPSTGTVTITEPAPASGAVVQLSNAGDFFNLDADLPPVLIIPAGATSATFPIRTHLSGSVATSTGEIIVGNYFGSTFQGAYLSILR
ncbi:MAG TPA: hypothetical protein VF400_14440 [Anaeromyxobacteraceae bacterium]